MIDDYDGQTLIDGTGEQVGTIERTYVDDDGNARLLAVKVGTLLHKHYLVPTDSLTETDDGIQVSWPKEAIEESPATDPTDTLEGDTLTAVRDYYDGLQDVESDDEEKATTTDDTQSDVIAKSSNGNTDIETEAVPAEFGTVRDLGDVVEVPIVEEVLVKKPVVREVLRVRKSRVTETGTAAADLRREHVEIVSGRDLVNSTNADQEEAS